MIATAVALGGASLVVLLRSRGHFGTVGLTPRLIAASGLWGVALLSLWLVLSHPGFDAARAGFYTFGSWQVGIGFLFGVLGLLAMPVYILVAKKLGGKAQSSDVMELIASASAWQRVFLLATASVAEEILFRAVPIGGLMAAGLPHLLAVSIPLVIFVLLHRSSWGAVHLLFVTLAGAFATAAFVLAGFWAAALAHLIVDAPLFLASKSMLQRGQPKNSGAKEGY